MSSNTEEWVCQQAVRVTTQYSCVSTGVRRDVETLDVHPYKSRSSFDFLFVPRGALLIARTPPGSGCARDTRGDFWVSGETLTVGLFTPRELKKGRW